MTGKRLSPLMRKSMGLIRDAGEEGYIAPFGRTLDALLDRGLIHWGSNPTDPLSCRKLWHLTDEGKRVADVAFFVDDLKTGRAGR